MRMGSIRRCRTRWTNSLSTSPPKPETARLTRCSDATRKSARWWIFSPVGENNPILVGEPGVGKTALVEGLALRIAEGNVPDALEASMSVRTLDLGLLQAGAGVKGEFEQRLKNIIEAVQRSPSPVLLFIDEAHTIIGAGNQAGGADAANLLKPALAWRAADHRRHHLGLNTSSTSSATPRWSAAFRWSRWMSRTTTPPA